MAEEQKSVKTESPASASSDVKAATTVAKDIYGSGDNKKRGGARPFKRGDRSKDAGREEFEQRILDIARVTRVMAGGKRMNFRACVGIGDKKGRVAVGLGKGADVTLAVNKAVNRAKKDMITVPMVNDTIPHAIIESQGAAKIMFKPARKGKGVIAGGVIRVLLDLAGVKNATSKILGTNNKINNARCTIEALRKLKKNEKHQKINQKEEKAENKADSKEAKK